MVIDLEERDGWIHFVKQKGEAYAGVEFTLHFKPGYGHLHAKAVVVDGTWASLGSANLNTRSYEFAKEANLIFGDPMEVGGKDEALFGVGLVDFAVEGGEPPVVMKPRGEVLLGEVEGEQMFPVEDSFLALRLPKSRPIWHGLDDGVSNQLVMAFSIPSVVSIETEKIQVLPLGGDLAFE